MARKSSPPTDLVTISTSGGGQVRSPKSDPKRACFWQIVLVNEKKWFSKIGKQSGGILHMASKMVVLKKCTFLLVFRLLTVDATFNIFTKFERSWHWKIRSTAFSPCQQPSFDLNLVPIWAFLSSSYGVGGSIFLPYDGVFSWFRSEINSYTTRPKILNCQEWDARKKVGLQTNISLNQNHERFWLVHFKASWFFTIPLQILTMKKE